MNTIGKTPEEQFLFPQSKSAFFSEERETEKSKRTKLFALSLQTNDQTEKKKNESKWCVYLNWLTAADHG